MAVAPPPPPSHRSTLWFRQMAVVETFPSEVDDEMESARSPQAGQDASSLPAPSLVTCRSLSWPCGQQIISSFLKNPGYFLPRGDNELLKSG